MELINKVSEKLAASSSRETRASEGCPTRKRRRNCLEKSFRRIRPISRLDESTYKWTKRLQNIRIESCWLVNAANDGPQKRISSLPLFQSSLNHRPFLQRLVSYQRREVWKNCRSKVSRPDSRSIGEDDEEIEKLRKNFETNIASQFQFYFSRMESGVYSRET